MWCTLAGACPVATDEWWVRKSVSERCNRGIILQDTEGTQNTGIGPQDPRKL